MGKFTQPSLHSYLQKLSRMQSSELRLEDNESNSCGGLLIRGVTKSLDTVIVTASNGPGADPQGQEGTNSLDTVLDTASNEPEADPQGQEGTNSLDTVPDTASNELEADQQGQEGANSLGAVPDLAVNAKLEESLMNRAVKDDQKLKDRHESPIALIAVKLVKNVKNIYKGQGEKVALNGLDGNVVKKIRNCDFLGAARSLFPIVIFLLLLLLISKRNQPRSVEVGSSEDITNVYDGVSSGATNVYNDLSNGPKISSPAMVSSNYA